MYFQNGDGNWFRYDQGAAEIPASGNIGFILGSSVPVDEPPQGVTQIETTNSQDILIAESAFTSQESHNSGETEYNLWSNNCTDAVIDVINNSGADISIPNPPLPVIPNSWAENYQDWLSENSDQTNDEQEDTSTVSDECDNE